MLTQEQRLEIQPKTPTQATMDKIHETQHDVS